MNIGKSFLNNRLFKPLQVVEHLIDCTKNPEIYQLLGDDEYCLNPSNSFLTGIKGFIEQVVVFGTLIITYYMLKRIDKGVIDWDKIVDEDENDNSDVGFNFDTKRQKQMYKKNLDDNCPLCSGKGSYINISNQEVKCELCGGDGIIRESPIKILPFDRSDSNENGK